MTMKEVQIVTVITAAVSPKAFGESFMGIMIGEQSTMNTSGL